MATIVSFIKHWDNDTRGTIEFSEVNEITQAIHLAERALITEATEDINDVDSSASIAPGQALFTITKVELGTPSNWLGVPAGL